MKLKFFLVLIIFNILLAKISARDKIKLSDIDVLTLNYGMMTNGRRSHPVPQLECVGGSANCKDKLIPKVVQCKNMGSDGYDVQWKCQAELPTNLKFGRIDVNCEGYDNPNDKYVLKGSCGLRYTLDLMNKQSGSKYESEFKMNESSSKVMYILIFVIVCGFIYYFFIYSNNQVPSGPPPPGFRPEYVNPPPYESVYNDRNTYFSTKSPGTGTGGSPGFWTGLGAGGLLGYLFGSRDTTNSRNYQTYNYHDYQTNLFNNDETYTHNRRSESDESSEFRTASGFGGTSRR